MKIPLKLVTVLLVFSCLINFCQVCYADASDSDLPPIRTEVKYEERKEKRSDDPENAWAEWDETPETRKNPFPKRQRKIEVGMDVNSIMGMAMRQEKVVSAVLTEEFGSSEKVGQLVTQKFKNQMGAAGIACRLWFVAKGRQVIARCDTIRDGHMCKDYMIRQREIMRTVIDNVPFTPRPEGLDDDDEDDEEDDKAETKAKPSSQPHRNKESEGREGSKNEL